MAYAHPRKSRLEEGDREGVRKRGNSMKASIRTRLLIGGSDSECPKCLTMDTVEAERT